MAEMHAEVFEAFRSIGASEDKAIKAAVALSAALTKARGPRVSLPLASRVSQESTSKLDANFEAIHLEGIQEKLNAIKVDIIGIKSEVAILKWMGGALLSMVMAILFEVFLR